VAVVYDGVGKDTFAGSLDCLRPLGMMVTFGNASGPVPPLDLIQLSLKGSLFVTRPTIASYTAKRDDLVALGAELFDMVASGQVRIEVNQTYALKDAAQAHRDLEARKTTGPPSCCHDGQDQSRIPVAARPVCHRLVDFLIVGIGFVVAYQFVEPAPPKKIVITTGGESGAYYQFAQRYATILARNGITLEVKASAGSLDNLARLQSNEAQVGFVQGGVVPPKEDPDAEDDSGLLSLGSLFYEPVWVFYRGERDLTRLTELRGKRIAIGQEGSGVRQLAKQLLDANEIRAGDHLVPLAGLSAAEELQQGRIDAAFIIAAETAPVVQVLLRSPGIKLMSFAQDRAYQRRFPFLTKLTFPQGSPTWSAIFRRTTSRCWRRPPT
jgi:TRAP transporter TAXI family solute receptor